MKQFPLVQVGHPKFRQDCGVFKVEEITSSGTSEIISRMKYTMRKVHGVGLAGPQIGLQKQLFVLRLTASRFRPNSSEVKPYAVFNPTIISSSKTIQNDWEGCFSVAEAGLFAKVSRAENIRVEYVNEKGQKVSRELSGLEARVFQHEYDHLHGKVYLDTAVDLSTMMSAKEYRSMREREAK